MILASSRALGSLLGLSGAVVGASAGALEASSAVFGPSWPSWWFPGGVLEAAWGRLSAQWAILRPSGAVLAQSWGSWEITGAETSLRPTWGPLFGPDRQKLLSMKSQSRRRGRDIREYTLRATSGRRGLCDITCKEFVMVVRSAWIQLEPMPRNTLVPSRVPWVSWVSMALRWKA